MASFSTQQVLPHKQQLVRDMEVIDSLVHLLQGALESRRVAPLHESPANSQSKNDDGEKSGEKDELGSEGGSVDAGTADGRKEAAWCTHMISRDVFVRHRLVLELKEELQVLLEVH